MVIHRRTLDVFVSDNDTRSETDLSIHPNSENSSSFLYNGVVIKFKRDKYSSLNRIEIMCLNGRKEGEELIGKKRIPSEIYLIKSIDKYFLDWRNISIKIKDKRYYHNSKITKDQIEIKPIWNRSICFLSKMDNLLKLFMII